MHLKISNADGTFIYSNDVVSFKTTSAGVITDVTYGATAVANIVAFNGANARYQIGQLTKTGSFDAWFSN